MIMTHTVALSGQPWQLPSLPLVVFGYPVNWQPVHQSHAHCLSCTTHHDGCVYTIMLQRIEIDSTKQPVRCDLSE